MGSDSRLVKNVGTILRLHTFLVGLCYEATKLKNLRLYMLVLVSEPLSKSDLTVPSSFSTSNTEVIE
jgi:hypothetical protein